jgi:hypothetical protein
MICTPALIAAERNRVELSLGLHAYIPPQRDPKCSKRVGRADDDCWAASRDLVWGDYFLNLMQWGMLPHIIRLGREPAGIGDPETLVERLEADLTAVRAQIDSNPPICGWTVRPQ